ncbi:MAG: ABC transporter substrate-binding protein/permease [Firmicutes bacterium]|nr:ABC transporter substrate-binding protein/permease [Bacillota bacterium]
MKITKEKNYISFAFVLLVIAAMLLGMISPVYAAESDIQTIADCNGKTIGVQTGCLYETHIADECPDAEIQYFTMPQDMILALNSQKIDAYLVEEVGFYATAAVHPELAPLEESAGLCEAAVIIGNNDKQERLLAEINEFIAKHGSEGDGMLDEMYDYWVKDFDAATSRLEQGGFTGENGELVIACEGGYEPFSYVNEEGDCGYDVDFVYRFCREYGYTPNIQRVAFESIAPGAESGKFDLGLNIILSDEREANVCLSDVYYNCQIFMVVLGDTEEGAGFIDKMKENFENTFIVEGRWKLFASGAGLTLFITVSSIVLGTAIGFGVFMLCRKGNRIINGITNGTLWLIHGMPTVLLLMILYYIVFGWSRLSGTVVSVVGFTLIFACAMYEMLSVGFGAIGHGQYEAATALGYNDSQSFFKILLPQAAKHFMPLYKNEVVTLIKETSVAGYIAVQELTKISDLVRARTYQAFFALIFTAIIYFLISGILTRIVGAVEKRIDPKKRSQEKILEGIEVDK